jgi:hypothetical protein
MTKGYDHPAFHARVEELELNKAKLENLILDLSLTVGVREYDFCDESKDLVIKKKRNSSQSQLNNCNSYRVPYSHISLKTTFRRSKRSFRILSKVMCLVLNYWKRTAQQ